MESKGLGDTVEKVTKTTGIKKIAKFIAGEDCGCDARKEALNSLFKYRKPECLIEAEYIVLNKYFSTKKNTVSTEEQNQLLKVYNRIFKKTNTFSTCGACVREVVEDLRQVYEKYNN